MTKEESKWVDQSEGDQSEPDISVMTRQSMRSKCDEASSRESYLA